MQAYKSSIFICNGDNVIIDIHTHIGIVKSWSKYLKGYVKVSLLDLIEYMDDVGIDKVALLPLPGRVEEISMIPTTERVIKCAKAYPDRIIPFCVIDPRATNAEDKIKKYVEKGCKGFGEFKVKLPIDDPRSLKLYKICAKLEIPILIHTDSIFNPDLRRFLNVLQEVPNAIFIMHGPGWWKHISAKVEEGVDYPTGKVVPGGLIEKIFNEYKNVYADISAYSGLNAILRDKEYAKNFLEKYSDRILYGTDFPCISAIGNQFGPNREHLNALNELKISKNALEKILYKNALKVLGLA